MSIPIPAETPDPNIDNPPTPPTEPQPVPEQEPPGTPAPPREEPPTIKPPVIATPQAYRTTIKLRRQRRRSLLKQISYEKNNKNLPFVG